MKMPRQSQDAREVYAGAQATLRILRDWRETFLSLYLALVTLDTTAFLKNWFQARGKTHTVAKQDGHVWLLRMGCSA